MYRPTVQQSFGDAMINKTEVFVLRDPEVHEEHLAC